jgi:hydroxyquinol 1,2-dioxygenase
MDGQGKGSNRQGGSAEQRLRLAVSAPGRLGDAVRLILDHAYDVVAKLQPSAEELDALVQFLTDVGYATDARRQEWVLLADVFGLTDAVMSRSSSGTAGRRRRPCPVPSTARTRPRCRLARTCAGAGRACPLP